MFGEMAVIEKKPRSASAMAARESTVYFIPRDEMLRDGRTLARAGAGSAA